MIGINKDLDIKYKDGVEYVLECVGNESLYLELMSSKDLLKQNVNLTLIRVGFINNNSNMPVCISCGVSSYNGMKYFQWEATSRFIDYNIINEWLDECFPNIPKTDVSNFHNLINKANKMANNNRRNK